MNAYCQSILTLNQILYILRYAGICFVDSHRFSCSRSVINWSHFMSLLSVLCPNRTDVFFFSLINKWNTNGFEEKELQLIFIHLLQWKQYVRQGWTKRGILLVVFLEFPIFFFSIQWRHIKHLFFLFSMIDCVMHLIILMINMTTKEHAR